MSKNLLNDIKNNFLATGVGSLPHSDARASVDLVFKVFDSHIPFWPQLPRRSFCENMYAQFCERLPGFKVDENSKSVWVDTKSPSYIDELEDCFNKIQAFDVDYFGISRGFAEGLYIFSQRLKGMNREGWAKAQVIGPLSLGLSLTDENKKPIIFNAELSELLPHFLALKAAWVARQIKANAGSKAIIFIDEPYFVAVGTSQCSLPRESIIEKINHVVGAIHDNGALAGIHCCGNTDWEMVMETNIDILNFDAYGYLDKLLMYEAPLASFLKRGGIPAIGIVPTDEDALVPGLAENLFDVLRKKPFLLKNGALITTSCGCNGLSQDAALSAQRLCVELAERLKKEF
ncbi:MAG: hypothetical protein HZB36_08055 [Candidatus Omnitrophica bacterium]|nr:hypothetical protein [Candidatus Omnitrophota bacterium]